MIFNRTLKKSIAVLLILITLGNVVAPTVSYALTSGPTAPEATSFEPVDTTDMVNTITGDLAYNMPLLEVPGPGGSYPVTLSYHGGIQPNLEASWVGLGWSLNTGAISRIVNSVPDDYNGNNSLDHIFWEGGTYDAWTFGVSVGIANVITVSAGQTYATDTYKGRGVGGYVGLGFGIGKYLSVSVQNGNSPFDPESTSSYGIGLGVSQSSMSAHVGVNFNSKGKFGISGGISASIAKDDQPGSPLGISLLGASISTDGKGARVGVAGMSALYNNSKNGKITTDEDHWSVDIPVYYGVNISVGRDYVRYWMDEKETLANYGSIFFPSSQISSTTMSTSVFDSYHLQGTESISEAKSPANFMEGSFADYDMYSVNAQGLGGYMRPYHYALSLYSQDIVKESDNTKEILGYYIPQHSVGVHYRFVNDFSNRVLNDVPDIKINETINSYVSGGSTTTDPNARIAQVDYSDWSDRLSETYTITETVPLLFPLGSPKTGIEGYESAGQKRRIPYVPGSKHIEYFENADILDINQKQSLAQRGFIESNSPGFIRSEADGKIGAFAITNSSGVTYHFSLPAYSFSEYTYQQSRDSQNKISFNDLQNKGRYAYTWYLSGVTGPDYVDRGPDGNPDYQLNEYDWGYWVEFQYGKWTSDYSWRNPGEGFNEDLDNNFQNFSKGKKELYYLNSINTATHSALFVKKLRADSKSTTGEYDFSVSTSSGTDPSVTWVDQGGYDVKMGHYSSIIRHARGGSSTVYAPYYQGPISTLCLDQILLFDRKALQNSAGVEKLSTEYNDTFVSSYTNSSGVTWTHTVPYHHGENVIDAFDILDPSFPKSSVLRQIDLNYDYSLCPGTTNSFDEEGNLYDAPTNSVFIPDNSYTLNKLGKLTLKSISFKGKGGVNLIPQTNFTYDYNEQFSYSGTLSAINSANVSLTLSSNAIGIFQRGDLLKFNQGSGTYYGYVAQVHGNNQIDLNIISGTPTSTLITNIIKTKNPPYHKDLYDIWGMYKMDYVKGVDDNLSRYPSTISASNTDVWSLREIEGASGAVTKIEYESDTYGKNALENLTMKVGPGTTDPSFGCPDNPYYQPILTTNAPLFYEANSANDNIDFTNRFYSQFEAPVLEYSESSQGSPVGYTYDILTVSPPSPNLDITSSKIKIKFCQTISSMFNTRIYAEGGTLFVPSSPLTYGGGIRVKKVSMVNSTTNEIRSTNYTYDFDGKSSGVTSYEPVPNYLDKDGTKDYKSQALKPLMTVLALARDIPSPGVYYGKVRISETLENQQNPVDLPGYTDFEFQTFDPGMIGIEYGDKNIVASSGSYLDQYYNSIVSRKITLRDFSQRLGNLKSITLYNREGNIVSKTVNQYLHDQQTDNSFDGNSKQYPELIGASYKSQGVIHEAFNHARWVKKTSATGELDGLISKREVYPSIQIGSKTIDYKSGITTETKNLAFDFYSGAVVKTQTADGYGNTFVTETTPAYKVYSSMGLKAPYGLSENFENNLHVANKNMLEQIAHSVTYKIGFNNIQSLVSASAQTWSDQTNVLKADVATGVTGIQSGIWRMKSSYSFIGDDNVALGTDGLYPASSFTEFGNWADETNVPATWQKNAEITLYDVYSHALEASDVNGNFAATLMTPDQTRVAATVANSTYGNIAFTGAEDGDNGTGVLASNLSLGIDASVNGSTAHTGSNSVKTDFEGIIFDGDVSPYQKYMVSVWSSTDQYVKLRYTSGSTTYDITPSVKRKAGDWYLLEASFFTKNPHVKVWCEKQVESPTGYVYFDDFRVHPFNSSMTSYVYNSWGELSHILNANNLYTKYEYDGMGRLKSTYQETFQANYGNQGVAKVSEVSYNYGKPYRVELTGSKTGPTGQIFPEGTVSVKQGSSYTYQLINSCEVPMLKSVLVDGQIIFPRTQNYSLLDGTIVSVDYGKVTLSNIMSPHAVTAQFNDYSGQWVVKCSTTDSGCLDGAYIYYQTDICGRQPDNVNYASSASQIPPNLQQYIPQGGCTATTNCNTGIQKQ